MNSFQMKVLLKNITLGKPIDKDFEQYDGIDDLKMNE